MNREHTITPVRLVLALALLVITTARPDQGGPSSFLASAYAGSTNGGPLSATSEFGSLSPPSISPPRERPRKDAASRRPNPKEYAFCGGNPVNRRDPFGLDEFSDRCLAKPTEEWTAEERAEALRRRVEWDAANNPNSGWGLFTRTLSAIGVGIANIPGGAVHLASWAKEKVSSGEAAQVVAHPVDTVNSAVADAKAAVDEAVSPVQANDQLGDPGQAALGRAEAVKPGAAKAIRTSGKFVAAAGTTMVCLSLGMMQSNMGAASKVAEAAEGGEGNFVYRGLAMNENPGSAITATAPTSNLSAAEHVLGTKPSCWISTTRSLEIAETRFGQNGVVRIDLSKVKTEVLDCTKGVLDKDKKIAKKASALSIRAQEVLIKHNIPKIAITVVGE